MCRGCFLLSFLFVLEASASNRAGKSPADSWTHLRGDAGTGVSEGTVSTAISDSLRLAWTSHLPGTGHSSPVISGGSVYLTTAFRNAQGELIDKAAVAMSVIAALCVVGVSLGWNASLGLRGLRLFGIIANLGLLLILAAAGRELLGTANDAFRTLILETVIAATALNTAREIGKGWAVALIAVGLTAVGISCLYFHRIGALPLAYQPGILAVFALLPAVCGGLCLRDWIRLRDPASRWGLVSPLWLAVLPLAQVGWVSYQLRNSPFWSIQPTRSLEFPIEYYLGTAALLALAGGLCWVGRSRAVARTTGLAWLAMGCFLLAPIVAAPLVNAFAYTKYQLVRGEIASPIGLKGLGAMVLMLFLAGLLPWVTGGGPNIGATTRRRLQAALILLVLPVGLLPILGARFGISGGVSCALVALEAETGRVRWIREGLSAAKSERNNAFNSLATPTPVIAGELVVAYFGKDGAFACQKDTGEVRWVYHDLPYKSPYGPASSPCATETAIVIQSDSSEDTTSYVVALSPGNGRPLWKRVRQRGESWRSPVSFRHGATEMVCIWTRETLEILDAATGELLHEIVGIQVGEGDPVCSAMVVNGELILGGSEFLIRISLEELDLSAGATKYPVMLPRKLTEGLGKIRALKSILQLEGDGPTCSTPALSEGRLIVVNDGGLVTCISITDERVLWKSEIGSTQSSPVIAGEHVYLTNEDGKLFVLRLADGAMGAGSAIEFNETIRASPAIANGSLFIRTATKIHRVDSESGAITASF